MSAEDRKVNFTRKLNFVPNSYDKLKDALIRAADPASDGALGEGDTLLIAEAWMRVQGGLPGDFRQHFYIEVKDGGYATRKVIPEEEGYWYAPYRQTFEEINGDGEIRTSVEGILIARTPLGAIREAKRMAFGVSFSSARNCLKTEVLLSGPLKFEGQKEPKWFDVRLITEKEESELRVTDLKIIKKLGYKIE